MLKVVAFALATAFVLSPVVEGNNGLRSNTQTIAPESLIQVATATHGTTSRAGGAGDPAQQVPKLPVNLSDGQKSGSNNQAAQSVVPGSNQQTPNGVGGGQHAGNDGIGGAGGATPSAKEEHKGPCANACAVFKECSECTSANIGPNGECGWCTDGEGFCAPITGANGIHKKCSRKTFPLPQSNKIFNADLCPRDSDPSPPCNAEGGPEEARWDDEEFQRTGKVIWKKPHPAPPTDAIHRKGDEGQAPGACQPTALLQRPVDMDGSFEQTVSASDVAGLNSVTEFTITATINPKGGAGTIFSKGEEKGKLTPTLLLTGESKLSVQLQTRNGVEGIRSGNLVIPTGTTSQVAVVVNNELDIKLFVNGVLDTQGKLTAPPIHNDGSLHIGNSPVAGMNGFKGKIEKVYMYCTPLTETELKNVDTTPTSPDDPATIGVPKDMLLPHMKPEARHAILKDDEDTFNGETSVEVNKERLPEISHMSGCRKSSELNEFTISLWLKILDPKALEDVSNPTKHDIPRVIFHKGGTNNARTPALSLDKENQLIGEVSSVSEPSLTASGKIPLAPNAWAHVAYILKKDSLSLFVNGVPDTSETLTDTEILCNEGSLFVGKDPWGPGFEGRIRQMFIYGRALSPQEVVALSADAPVEKSQSVGQAGENQPPTPKQGGSEQNAGQTPPIENKQGAGTSK